MNLRLFLVSALFSLALLAPFGVSQMLNPQKLLEPATDAWPTYNGDYSGRRYSTLTQINTSNIGSLAVAWMYRITNVGLQRGVGEPVIKSTPLMVNGILYFNPGYSGKPKPGADRSVAILHLDGKTIRHEFITL